MKKKRYSEAEIVALLQEAEAAPTKAEVWRKHGISQWTYYRWRQRYAGVDVPQVRRLKQLEGENARLKRLVADQMSSERGPQRGPRKKGAVVMERREIVAALVERGIAERLACRTVGLGRSSYRYQRQRPARHAAFSAQVVATAQAHPR